MQYRLVVIKKIPTFQDSLLVPSSRVKHWPAWPLQLGLIVCPRCQYTVAKLRRIMSQKMKTCTALWQKPEFSHVTVTMKSLCNGSDHIAL